MRTHLLVLTTVSLLFVACGGSETAQEPRPSRPYDLPRGSAPVELDPNDFVARIANPYWPMVPGSRWVYRETGSDGTKQRVVVEVTDRTKSILGIPTTVVHDQVSEGGEVVEDTWDWYAQDKWGGLWYMGEDTTEYENGKPVSKEGSWEAGVRDAQPGLIIPPDPEVGMVYRQEYLRGEAEDQGEVLSVDERARVPLGSFEHLLMTEDTTPLEPDVVERKYYAKGVGPILAVSVSGGGGREKLVSFRKP